MIRFIKALILIVFPILLTCFISCSSVGDLRSSLNEAFFDEELADSAVNTVELFLDSVMEKDFDSAFGLIKKDGKTIDDFKEEFSDVTDIISYEINWVEVKNNVAEVGIDIMDSYDGTEKIYKDLIVSLVREGESDWKIAFWG